jgi:hypothetical protein
MALLPVEGREARTADDGGTRNGAIAIAFKSGDRVRPGKFLMSVDTLSARWHWRFAQFRGHVAN